MDSSSRYFTGRLRDFCVWRDQVCRLGGGRIAEVDHREEVREHGQTSARNGQSVGRLSHRIKDHPGIAARMVDPGSAPGAGSDPAQGLGALRAAAPEVEWEMPTGHRYLSVPPPALGPGARPDPLAWLDQRDEREGYRHFVAACDESLTGITHPPGHGADGRPALSRRGVGAATGYAGPDNTTRG